MPKADDLPPANFILYGLPGPWPQFHILYVLHQYWKGQVSFLP